jgi:hypothetical protein
MSLTHPVFPPENNASTNLPTAFANLNAALRALDGADTLVIDAGATPLDTVLPRIPQVLAVHGTPSALDGNGRYVLRLPSNGSTDQILIVANRTGVPLRLATADGANALVASLAAGRIEAFVLSGSTIGAYALSSTRTGKASTGHTHPASEITGLPAGLRTEMRRASIDTDLPTDDWYSVSFDQPVGPADIGLIWQDGGRTFVVPPGVSKIRLQASMRGAPAMMGMYYLSFSKNAPDLTGPGAWATFEGNAGGDFPGIGDFLLRPVATAWVPVAAGDFFRVIARVYFETPSSVLADPSTWVSVDAL